MGLLIEKKSVFLLSLVFIIIALLLYPTNNTFAQIQYFQEDTIELSSRDINIIINSLFSEITNERINIFSRSNSEPEEEAVMVILGMGIRSNSLNYLINQAPKEIAIEFIKSGVKIASLSVDPGISNLIKFGTNEIKKKAIEWLVKNEIKIGGGNMSISSYTAYDGNMTAAEFKYIITYNPKNGDIEIKIYSFDSVKPPKSRGSFTNYGSSGGIWDETEWFKKNQDALPPFTVIVNGKIEKSQYGGYLWKEGPIIDVDLSSPVPKFEFKPLSAIDRQILSLNKRLLAAKNALGMVNNTLSSAGEKISETAQNAWDKIKSGISGIANIGGASISSLFFSPGNDNTTVISLQDEIRSFKDITERDEVDDNEEVEELKKIITNLENELETALWLGPENEVKNDMEVQEVKIQEKVEINSAGKDDLTKIIHIGPARAEEIIKLRPFSSLDDLIRVSGIGAKTVEDIKEQGCAYVKNSNYPQRFSNPPPVSDKNPKIELLYDELSFLWEGGESPIYKELIIRNIGDATLEWTILSDREWLSFDIESGFIFPNESSIIKLIVDPSQIGKGGEHIATISIYGDDDSPHIITSSLLILSPPILAQNVIITEIKVNQKEFIKIYNPTDKDIYMEGWQISYYSSDRKWNNPYRNWSFPEESVINPQSYFLIGVYGYPEENGDPDADLELLTAGGTPYNSGQLANNNGSIALFDCNPKGEPEKIFDCRIDAVGWGDTFVRKGDSAKTPKEGKSISRRKNSYGNYIDNENNTTDFIITMPYPTNSKGETADHLPPEPITDLLVECRGDEAILEWTAPSDSDTPQEILSYEIRYHKKPLSESNWEEGTLIDNPPSVSMSGSAESFDVVNLNYKTNYYFGIMTLDTKNRSPISNIVSCNTDSIEYSSFWSGFQGDQKRRGRTDFVPLSLPEEPIVDILVSGERDNDSIEGPILISGKSIFFKGKITIEDEIKEGLLSFDNTGEYKWHRPGGSNRFSSPIMLADGSIFISFQEEMYEKTRFMKINRDGTIDWEKEIVGYYPVGYPAISNQLNKIYLSVSASDGESGKLIAFNEENGNIIWEYAIDSPASPSVGDDGTIYLSIKDTLQAINPNGNQKWERSFPFIAPDESLEYGRTQLSVPVIDNDTIYLIVKGVSETISGKRDHLYALDPHNPDNEKWRIEDLSGLRGLPALDHKGNVFIFNYSDPVFKNVMISGYDISGNMIEGWPLNISLAGIVESLIIGKDNSLFGSFEGKRVMSFDSDGNKKWRVDELTGYRDGNISMDENGKIYIGGSRYLYVIK